MHEMFCRDSTTASLTEAEAAVALTNYQVFDPTDGRSNCLNRTLINRKRASFPFADDGHGAVHI